MTDHLRLAWRILFVAFAVEAAVLAIAQVWGLLAFAALWGVGAGALFYRARARFAAAMKAAGLGGYAGFALCTIVISVTEETICSAFGCKLAHPVLWIDLVFVSTLWLVWLTGWYFVIAPRFQFKPDEALFIAACGGVLFEIVGNGSGLANPVIALLSVPGVIMVYAAICVLPFSLVPWTGTRETRAKVPAAFFVPYILTVPAVLVFFLAFSLAGIPL